MSLLWTAAQCAGAGVVCWITLMVGRVCLYKRPDERLMLLPENLFAIFVMSFWPPKGWSGNMYSHFIPFDREGSTVMPLYSPLSGEHSIQCADATALNAIMNDRKRFVKAPKVYGHLSHFGKNIIGTEGDEWLRHRSVARLAFSEKNNALLWKETVRILQDWSAEWDAQALASGSVNQVTVDFTHTLKEITLFIIASAGFGIQFSRSSVAALKPGYTMSFGTAVFVVIETMFVRIFVPRWLYHLPIKTLHESDEAFFNMRRYIDEMIGEARQKSRQETAAGEAVDLFRRLIAANETEDSSRLTDDELVANIYAFFLAGHETSSHTLTFAFALLAMHPDIQDRIFDEASALWPDTTSEAWTSSTMVDYPRLEYTLAALRETLRLFPAVPVLLRVCTADTVLPRRVRNPTSQEWEPNMSVTLNIHSLHMDPFHWGEDVEDFRPERFIDTDKYQWPRDAWLPFTAGPHVCIGQRFAIIESVCILARMVRMYRIAPTPEVARLSKQEQWKMLTHWTMGMTATPGAVKLVMEKRQR
ncbi:cytochrome P450 [Auriculariales sp. MPI-PUGE-AT-0066]|nr:cytochrome P450 [Auriculariales sp. MPI-PUGE-AT-0066]